MKLKTNRGIGYIKGSNRITSRDYSIDLNTRKHFISLHLFFLNKKKEEEDSKKCQNRR